jgi:hypothetical protein
MSKQYDASTFDGVLRDAFVDIDVPSNRAKKAAERLQASLLNVDLDASQKIDDTNVAAEFFRDDIECSEDIECPAIAADTLSASNRSRRLFAGGLIASMAVAASLFLALKLLPGGTDLTVDSLIDGSRSLVASIQRDSIDWESNSEWPPQAGYQIDTRRTQLQMSGFTRLAYNPFGGLSQSADVWRMQSKSGDRLAYWIEVKSQDEIPGLTGTMKSLTNSGQWTVAAMQAGDRVFVLVSNGDVGDLLHSTTFA